MQLDSARELKQQFMSELGSAMASANTVKSLGVRAQISTGSGEAMRSIALGLTQKGKQHQLAVRIQRRSMESHPILEEIKKTAKGEVDVRFVGKLLKLETPSNLQKKRRPLVIGCSIGHFKITAGTLGCFVKDRTTGEIFILSNNHVLANEGSAQVGDKILQQGKFDGGTVARNTVGTLRRFVKLKKSVANLVDCAVADIKSGINRKNSVLGSFGNLAGLGGVTVVR
ncbi:MAG: hypothetical protein U0930_13470 [Pirellulales bacterium]